MVPGRRVRSIALFGDDHIALGEIAVGEIPPRLALALSRGKFPKGYAHLDANEDGCLIATDGVSSVLAVVDGHSGFDAARAALLAVEAHTLDLLAQASTAPRKALLSCVEAAGAAVTATVSDQMGDRAGSRSTLAVALMSQDRLTVVGLGDSGVALVRGSKAQHILPSAPFLGPGTDMSSVSVAADDIESGDRVVVATDGLFDFLGRDWHHRLAGLAAEAAPAALARQAVEAAFMGGAGDNIAVAVALA